MQFNRTEILIGEKGIKKLQNSKVAVFGLGGVGGHATEALARAGIGSFDLYDFDKVDLSNLNRQIIALHSTVGKYKTETLKLRILDINPSCQVQTFNIFYNESNHNNIPLNAYDYIVDAIDSVKSKVLLIENAKAKNIPIISAMGAGNKIESTKFEVSDIKKTSVCPLARVIRKQLKEKGITSLKVVYSKEQPIKQEHTTYQKPTTGSMPYTPAIMGLIIASEVIKDIISD